MPKNWGLRREWLRIQDSSDEDTRIYRIFRVRGEGGDWGKNVQEDDSMEWKVKTNSPIAHSLFGFALKETVLLHFTLFLKVVCWKSDTYDLN